jgi:hypothetical protein
MPIQTQGNGLGRSFQTGDVNQSHEFQSPESRPLAELAVLDSLAKKVRLTEDPHGERLRHPVRLGADIRSERVDGAVGPSEPLFRCFHPEPSFAPHR